MGVSFDQGVHFSSLSSSVVDKPSSSLARRVGICSFKAGTTNNEKDDAWDDAYGRLFAFNYRGGGV